MTKLRGIMIFEALFYLGLIGIGVFGLMSPEVLIFGKICTSIVMAIVVIAVFYHIKNGPWYQEDKYIHRDAFNKVIACNNALIIVDVNNNAWIFWAKKQDVKKLDSFTHFKCRFFYTLSGKTNASFKWLVYQQLEDLRKGNKDEQLVQNKSTPTKHYDSVG